MNRDLARLQPYPHDRLRRLLEGILPAPGLSHIDMSIGEPKHAPPPFIRDALVASLSGLSQYPTTRGSEPLRRAISTWLHHRFGLADVDPERHVLPVNGTREALFSIAQAVLDRCDPAPVVATANPFYQIYEGAALLAGAELLTLPLTRENRFLPDYDRLTPDVLQRLRLLYLCSPHNPTGSVHDLPLLRRLVELAQKHDFVIASDECYSEVWFDRPPSGILQAAQDLGVKDYQNCLAFHSLSKRSSIPGARSGFVAGDPRLLERYFLLRTYTGCTTPPFIQDAAAAAWNDESHVQDNRDLYAAKMELALALLSPHLPVERPQAGFYLWLRTPGGGEAFTKRLFRDHNLRALPGAYLARDEAGAENPGAPYLRIALVHDLETTQDALERIAACAQDT